jgi:hypothetical protein
VEAVDDGTGHVPREVTRVSAPGQADHDEATTGPQELAHAFESFGLVHVVQGGYTADEVEGVRLAREFQEVRVLVVDALFGSVPAGDAENRLVTIDGRHMRHDSPEPAGEQAVTAADLQSMLCSIGHRVEDDGVVVDVVVPRGRF